MTVLIKREDLLTPDVVRAIQLHAIEEYPSECIGAITPQGYQRMKNVAAKPDRHASPPHAEMVELLDQKRLLALVHSHPDGPNCPSGQDMALQLELEVPFVIVSTDGKACLAPFAWGDQLEPFDLLNRGFQHGVTDCYELIRDEKFLRDGVRLKQFPRNWLWWNDGEKLYEDGFSKAGYREIRPGDQRPGDVFLACVRSPTPNHAGVLVEPGVVLHHGTPSSPFAPSKLAKRVPAIRYRDFISHWIRYDP